jgi:aspartate/methionine/tyrosine aminotransferase
MLLRKNSDGILLPVPFYPLYNVLTMFQDATAVHYNLDADANWSINPK